MKGLQNFGTIHPQFVLKNFIQGAGTDAERCADVVETDIAVLVDAVVEEHAAEIGISVCNCSHKRSSLFGKYDCIVRFLQQNSRYEQGVKTKIVVFYGQMYTNSIQVYTDI